MLARGMVSAPRMGLRLGRELREDSTGVRDAAEGAGGEAPQALSSQVHTPRRVRPGWAGPAAARQVWSFLTRTQVCPAHLGLLLCT